VTVLVIDAAAAVRGRLVARLREAGVVVVGEAANGEAALALAFATLPTTIVLDVDLPGRRGLELIALLKAAVPGVAVVVLTNALPYRRAALAAGADFFLDKSSEFDAVAAMLAR
jgi:DNA-binding NarL/FixJ family response regulator